MTRASRILLGLLVVAMFFGMSGVGLETRDAKLPPVTDAALGIAYTVLGLLTLVALGASWTWPRLAGWCAIGAGLLAVVLPALDVANVLQPVPPPPAMLVVNTVLTILGALFGLVGATGHWRACASRDLVSGRVGMMLARIRREPGHQRGQNHVRVTLVEVW